MTREAQAKIDALVLQKLSVVERVQRLKYSISGDEAAASDAPHNDRKYERQRLKYERLTKVLVSVKAGIQHLSERLEGVKLDEPPLVLTDDNMVEVLTQCEQRLRIVLDAIRQEEDALVRDMGEAALQVAPSPSSIPPQLHLHLRIEARTVLPRTIIYLPPTPNPASPMRPSLKIVASRPSLLPSPPSSLWQRNAGLPLEPPVVNNYRVKDSENAEEAPSEEEFEEVHPPPSHHSAATPSALHSSVLWVLTGPGGGGGG